MPIIGWHGEPCALCKGPIKRAATHHGLCAQHWLGATETERAIHRFNNWCDSMEDSAILEFRRELNAYGHPPVA